jgi:cardiolipin synthase A/B
MANGQTTLGPSTEFYWPRSVDESFELMLQAIHQAQVSICLEMYIYSASPIGEQFREALVRASERGLHVRVLIDAWGSMTLPDRFWDALREAGGELRWFNPIQLRRFGIRNHRKLLVCDRQLAFVGGFNIAPEYQGDGLTKGWHDLGLQMTGGLAEHLASSFDTLFALADFQHKRFIPFRKAVAHQTISTPDGQILLIGPGHNRHFVKQTLLADLNRATSIQIISAYFLPTRVIRRALMRAARRRCKVQLILAGKSDVPLSQHASRKFYQTFLRAGLEIFEYQPQILHSKLFIVDETVYAGSANLDRRSFSINYELMLRLPNHSLALEARRIFQNALDHSKQIDISTWKKSRTLWNKIKEQWAFFLLAKVDPFIARRQLRNLR